VTRLPSSIRIVGYLGPVLVTEHFSRIFGPNRMRISGAAEFLFCRFRRFREIVYFLSDRWIRDPISADFTGCLDFRQKLAPADWVQTRIVFSSTVADPAQFYDSRPVTCQPVKISDQREHVSSVTDY
jgi:hypothetical protein